MKFNLKTYLKFKDYLQMIILWIVAFFFYVFITYSIIDDFYFKDHLYDTFDLLLSELFAAFCTGIFMGTNLFVLNEFVYPLIFKKYGMLFAALLQSALFLIIAFIGLLIILELNKAHYITIDNLFILQIDLKWIISFTIYCLVVHIFITLLLAFRRRLGKSYFEGLLRGNYMIPVVEYRIFMFIDMQSSTTTAEQSGHYNYSLLLQECFMDLSEVLVLYDAEVYQYVGDEAILTWRVTEHFRREKCIELLDAFFARILDKSEFYNKRFGFVPNFKASINEGLVTVAEIGQIKTEIAYHGDVLSTAARVQDLCNHYNTYLLITESFFEHLTPKIQKIFVSVDSKILRGKKKEVVIYKPSK